MRKNQLVLMAVLLLIGVLVVGCSSRTKISKILNNPDSYLNKDVTIAGVVTKTYAVNLIITQAGAYQLDDGSGQIWVITHTSVPKEGSKVGLKGTVSDKIDLLGLAVAVVVKEKERRIKD